MKCFKKNLADLFTLAINNEAFFKCSKCGKKFQQTENTLVLSWFVNITFPTLLQSKKKGYGRCFLNICILLSFICKFFNKNLAKLCIQHPNTNKKNFYHPKPILS